MVPIEHVYDQIRAFAADAGARKVVLFGSRAKGVNRPKSDIDLAVAGCPDFNRLEQNLQDNLWSLLKVDVINLCCVGHSIVGKQITRRRILGLGALERAIWQM